MRRYAPAIWFPAPQRTHLVLRLSDYSMCFQENQALFSKNCAIFAFFTVLLAVIRLKPISVIQEASSSCLHKQNNKTERANALSVLLNWFDNNDTVSNIFIWFHSKNETIKREVKLSFGIETTLISLSNCNLAISKILF